MHDDRNADIQNFLGYAYRRLLRLDAAMQHYQQALTLNPQHRSAHEHLGEAYFLQGSLSEWKRIRGPGADLPHPLRRIQ